MSLFVLVNQNLSEPVLRQLAGATATSLAATQEYARLASSALVEALAQPVSLNDLNARWDMCRQIFLSQLLTETDELLRTDMGWPERRIYLAQNILGELRFADLTTDAALPPQAPALLGYLTMLTLATIGQHASQTSLAPADLGTWLSAQEIPAGSPPAATSPPLSLTPPVAAAPLTAEPIAVTKLVSSQAATPEPAANFTPALAPAAATPVPASKRKATMLSVVGVLAVAGLAGGYFLLGTPANATQQENTAATPATVSSALPAAVPTAEAKPAPTISAAVARPVAAAPKPVPAKTGTAPVHTTAGAVLIDTIGNAAQASHIGGSYNAALGRYPKGEGQPLDIKLINRSTLSVGINSSESLLYKRLVNSNLSRPSSVALDRLVFDPSKAKLGAEGAQQLGNIATLLKTFPKAHILVLGHATTKEAEAMRLSLLRANAAIDELVKQGISADRLQAQGVLATGVPAGANAAEKLAMQQGVSLSVSRL